MRKGTFSNGYWNGRGNRPSRWKQVIQSEEDDRWFLVTNGKEYGLQHQCQKVIDTICSNPVADVGKWKRLDYSGGCLYCKSPIPNELMAILKLHEFGTRE